MRYAIGAICVAGAAVLLGAASRHRARVLARVSREALEARRTAALADPKSVAALGEIGRPLVLFFVGWLGVKAGLLYLLFHAGRWLSVLDLLGFYSLLYAYGVYVTFETRYRLSDALAIEAARAPALSAAAGAVTVAMTAGNDLGPATAAPLAMESAAPQLAAVREAAA